MQPSLDKQEWMVQKSQITKNLPGHGLGWKKDG